MSESFIQSVTPILYILYLLLFYNLYWIFVLFYFLLLKVSLTEDHKYDLMGSHLGYREISHAAPYGSSHKSKSHLVQPGLIPSQCPLKTR